ncbi:MAG: NERD domain-containing protein [Bacteroidota bacterium]
MSDIIHELLLFTVLVCLLIYAIFSRRIKGAIGEQTVSWRLSLLPKSKYKVVNNLVLKVGDKTVQIDHLIISNYGVFVIETKNLKGWIFGYENYEFWTQVIFKRKERFYNPIRQNLGHIKALKSTLNEFHGVKYVSIIAFCGKCTLKVETDTKIVYSDQLIKTIKRYSEVQLSDTEKDAIFERITLRNISRSYNRDTHIKDIKKRISDREDSINRNICPQCGGNLVIRTSANGRFKACCNYPRCKFTTNS